LVVFLFEHQKRTSKRRHLDITSGALIPSAPVVHQLPSTVNKSTGAVRIIYKYIMRAPVICYLSGGGFGVLTRIFCQANGKFWTGAVILIAHQYFIIDCLWKYLSEVHDLK